MVISDSKKDPTKCPAKKESRCRALKFMNEVCSPYREKDCSLKKKLMAEKNGEKGDER